MSALVENIWTQRLVHLLHSPTLSVADNVLKMLRQEWIMRYRECAIEHSWSGSGYNPGIYLEELRKTIKYFSQSNRYLCWHSNRTDVPAETNLSAHWGCVAENSISQLKVDSTGHVTQTGVPTFLCAGISIGKRGGRGNPQAHRLSQRVASSQSPLDLCCNGVVPSQTDDKIVPSLT